MAKFLVLWEVDNAKVPIDPKERGAAWGAMLGMVKQEIEAGITTEWGALAGENKGFAIMHGTVVELALNLQKYVPFISFTVHALQTVDEVGQVIAGLQAQG